MAKRKRKVKRIVKKSKKIDEGKIFLGGLFLLIAAYIFITQTGVATRFFAGGVLALLGIITLATAFKK